MNRPKRPPNLSIDDPKAPERSSSSYVLPELIVDRPSPYGSEHYGISIQDWDPRSKDAQTTSDAPSNVQDQRSEAEVSLRFGRWANTGAASPASTRPVSPAGSSPQSLYHPPRTLGKSRRRGRTLQTGDGQSLRERARQDINFETYNSITEDGPMSPRGFQRDTISALHADPPDSVIVNRKLYAYDPRGEEYIPFGQVESIPGSPTSPASTPSVTDYFDPMDRRPPLSRLPSQQSLNEGDKARFYRSNAAAESTQSLAAVLAEAQDESPAHSPYASGLPGLTIDTSGNEYRNSWASYTSTVPSSPNSPGAGSSRSSPSDLRRMYSSASRLMGSIEALPEASESDDSIQHSPVNKNEKGIELSSFRKDTEGGNKAHPWIQLAEGSVGSNSRQVSEPLTGLARKKEVWKRFWRHKVSLDFRSSRQKSGTPSPAISPTTGRTLSPEEYGYEVRYPKAAFVTAKELSQMSATERERLKAVTASMRSEPSTSRIRLQTYDPTRFQSFAGRVQQAQAQARDNAVTAFGLAEADEQSMSIMSSEQDTSRAGRSTDPSARTLRRRSSSKLGRTLSSASSRLFG
ncbi:hypothetical protein I204_00141 [Kwoniella mangroviensis CBS 8886]|nr:hypothetical protein I204_00141 [Kwoniella mangroviensis CBS 8886]